MTEIKFCGLTRGEDARLAAELGASYLGVIFAGGPRLLTPDRAREVLREAPSGPRRVGVFATDDAEAIARVVEAAELDVVQLHAGATAASVAAVRATTGANVWAVLRVTEVLPERAAELFDAADAVLLDAHVPGQLGGTGVALPWERLAASLLPIRRNAAARLVLAGGLHAGNVAAAIGVLAPDVVDVSSGVESAPGMKDPQRLRAFRDAVRASETTRT